MCITVKTNKNTLIKFKYLSISKNHTSLDNAIVTSHELKEHTQPYLNTLILGVQDPWRQDMNDARSQITTTITYKLK